MADEAERVARMALTCVVEPGDLKLGPMLERFGAEELWQVVCASTSDHPWTRRAQALKLPAVRELAARHGIRFVIPSDAEWPAQLGVLATGEPVQGDGGVPAGLWVRGQGSLAALTQRSVAIVGARASTAYGDRVAADLAAGLAAAGVTVVSGGAYGIDAAAHRGSLAEGGPTVAVLARGLDDAYPRAHAALLASVAERGVVVSELPPGESPSRRRFLTRNRLIAALTTATIIVEAAVRSGAKNTATWVTACGRQLLAVPGPVGNATSYTPHQLIRGRDAELVSSVAEVLELIAPVGQALVERPRVERLLDGLDPGERAVYEALPSRGSRDVGDLAVRSGLVVPSCLAALQRLADASLAVACDDGGWRLGRVQDRPVAVGSAQQKQQG